MGVGAGASSVAPPATAQPYAAATARQAVGAAQRGKPLARDDDTLPCARAIDPHPVHHLGLSGRLREAARDERAGAEEEAIVALREAVVGIEDVVVLER